jgi:hypothetical protein
MWTLGHLTQNLIIYESNTVFLLLKIYIGFYIRNFYIPFFPPGVKKVDPYFRENESSEASGSTVRNFFFYKKKMHGATTDGRGAMRGAWQPRQARQAGPG